MSSATFKVAPEYRFEAPEGPPHAPTFRVAVVIEGREVSQGTGKTKKAAIRQAAHRAWHTLTDTPLPEESA